MAIVLSSQSQAPDGLEKCRVDLSAVVSKHVGKTEKTLRRVFDGAKRRGAIPLFARKRLFHTQRIQCQGWHLSVRARDHFSEGVAHREPGRR
jgi:hypothetical protein